MFENWLILSLLAVLMFSLTQLLDKACVSDFFKTIRGWMSVAGIFALFPTLYIFFIIKPSLDAMSSEIMALTVISGMVQMIAYYFYARAMVDEGADIISVLWQVMPIYAAIASVVLFGDILNIYNYIGIALITVVAIYLMMPKEENIEKLFYRIRALIKKKSFIFMQITCLLTLASTLVLDQLASDYETIEIMGFSYLGYVIVGLAFLKPSYLTSTHIKSLLADKHLLMIIVIAMGCVEFFDAMGYYFIIEAYMYGDYAIITALMALQPMVIIMLAGIYKKLTSSRFASLTDQTHSITTKTFAITILTVGVYTLTI